MEYYIGQIFEEMYPPEAAEWCNNGNGYIEEIEPLKGVRRFEIKAVPELTPEERRELINNLTMTPLDFIKVLEGLGLTLSQINEFLDAHLNIKTQLTYCNSVYCGVVKSFLPIEIEGKTITTEIVETAFKAKNGVV